MSNNEHFKQPLANFLLPFPAEDLEWRAGSVTKGGDKVQLLPYITARGVMDRLDNVVGPQNWKAEYHKSPIGDGLECRLSIKMRDGSWVTKTDAAPPTNFEPVKGAYSDALKRAAVHWGIGRYLYTLDIKWQPIQDKGKIYISSKGRYLGYANPPQLPPEALPAILGYEDKPAPPPKKKRVPKKSTKKATKKAEAPAPAPEEDTSDHDPGWQDDRSWFCAKCDQFGGYEHIKNWTVSQNWGKPSSWETIRRRSFVMKLGRELAPPPWR